MVVLFCVVFFSLAPLGLGQIVQGEGQDFFNCGQHECIDETGVTCNGNNECECPPGQVGDARIQCADPDDECLCTVVGDPHMTTFSGHWFSLPLPCAHIIADVEVGTNPMQACKVDIIGAAIYEGNPPNPYAAYESRITIQVLAPNAVYTASIERTQVPVTNITHFTEGSPGIEVREFKEDGLLCIEIPSCNLTIKYKDAGALFSLLASSIQTTGAGLCGECGDDRPNPPVSLDPFQALKNQLQSLPLLSSEEDINEYDACRNLAAFYPSCPEDRKPFVVGYCGSILIQAAPRDCIFELTGTARTLVDVFLTCVTDVCNRQTCFLIQAQLGSCTFDGMQDYLSNSTFCTNPPIG